MRVISGISIGTWALAALLATSAARGDGPCDAGIRDTSAAERATMTAVLEAVKAALPPAPAGWVIVGDDAISVTKNLCRDYERDPWRYGFTRYYQRIDDQATRDKAIADAAAIMQADMAKKQSRLDAIQAKVMALSARQVALVEKGDITGATALNEQMASLQEEYRKIADEGDAAARTQALYRQASRDQAMTVVVSVNPPYEASGLGAKPVRPPPPGAASGSRWSGNDKDRDEDAMLMLVGRWRPAANGALEPVPRAGVAPEAANAISVRISAAPERIVDTLRATDFSALAGALAR